MAEEELQGCQPQKCSSLRKNGFALLQGFPCKIVDMSTAKTGKHGGAKVHLVGTDIFTEKKYEEISGSTVNMNVPEITRNDYQLIDIEDPSDQNSPVTLLDGAGITKEDCHLPNMCESDFELGQKIVDAFNDGKEVTVTVVAAMGVEAIKAYRCKDI
eukprot:TRINITY_DN9567_c0_g1_i4.p1 TRINITY_DN9567_c0_g1~~TRINITY_DN9567_c0_g1_i4.p1  ORF type:complete len:157 (-),score=39.49 TRINITY_DN9567_c0_g1_i4:118-588(-)